MSKFSRKGLNSRKPWTSVLEHCNDLFPCKRLDVWFELILSECVRSLIWTVPLFEFSIPANNWLLLTWTFPFEPLFLQPIVLWWWTYFLANDWLLLVRWIDSVFPRTFISIDEMKFLHTLFKLLIRTEISIWFLTCTFSSVNELNFYFCKSLFDLCLIYDCGLIFLQMFEFWSNDELIQYSREHLFRNRRHHCLNFQRWTKCLKSWLELKFSFWTVIPVDLNRYSWTNEPLSERMHFDRWLDQSMNWHFLLNFWTDIPAECIWSMTWTVIPERTIEFSSMIWTDCLTFDRSLNWFSISCGNFGLIWLLTCTVAPERTFEFCNPVTFVWLRNERFPAYVFRDSGCFELSVQLYTCFRSRIWTSEALPLYMFPH